VSNIAEHDRKQEREGDDGKEARVDLLVRRDAVRVHDRLEALRELVRPMERGWGPIRAQLMQDRRHGGARFLLHHREKKKKKISRPEISAQKIISAHGGVTERQLDHGDIASGAPPLRDKRLAADIVVKQVKRLVHGLLLSHEVLPAEDALADLAELSAACTARVEQRHLEVLDAAIDLAQRVDTLIGVRVDRVDRRAEGLGYPADLSE
jgi:hypothetical protein